MKVLLFPIMIAKTGSRFPWESVATIFMCGEGNNETSDAA